MDCSRCKNGILEKYYEAEYHDIYRCKNCEYEEIKRSDECCRNPNKIVVNDVKFFQISDYMSNVKIVEELKEISL